MLTFCLQLFSFLKEVMCWTKNYAGATKNTFHIEVRYTPKLCESQKYILRQQKNYVTPIRDSC